MSLANFISSLAPCLQPGKKCAIITHHNPDGDAVGASLALNFYLKVKGLDVQCVVPSEFPEFYRWMPGTSGFVVYRNQPEIASEILREADLIFCLDFNHPERTEEAAGALMEAKGMKILIDHHQLPSGFFHLSYSDTSVSSTAEMVYRVVEAMGDLGLISHEMATALYVGIVTDTGSFSYNCNHPETYLAIAELVKHNLDVEKIQQRVYGTFSEDRVRLLGYCLAEGLKIFPGLRLALIRLDRATMKKYHFRIGDNEGIVNYGLTIEDVVVSAMFTEREKYVKLSLRSKGDFNVGLLAREHFNGGGHKNAAGGNIYSGLEDAVQAFLSTLASYTKEIQSVDL